MKKQFFPDASDTSGNIESDSEAISNNQSTQTTNDPVAQQASAPAEEPVKVVHTRPVKPGK